MFYVKAISCAHVVREGLWMYLDLWIAIDRQDPVCCYSPGLLLPDENLVGKAVAIWISFEFDRAPDSWLPSWVPSGVRFSRVGGIQ